MKVFLSSWLVASICVSTPMPVGSQTLTWVSRGGGGGAANEYRAQR